MAFVPDQIRTIHLIAATGSFVMAAELLNKVPSAISYNVKKWEEELGFQLFNRNNRQIQLTPAGAYYIEQTKWMLDSYDSMIKVTSQIANNEPLSFSIAINNIIKQDTLHQLITFLNKAFPATQIILYEEVYNGTWDALYSKKVDLVIGAPHTAPRLEGIICESLGDLEWDFVVGNAHPLSQTTEILEAHTLRQYPAILVRDSAKNLPQKDTWSLIGQKTIYVHHLDFAIELIRQGVGIGYIPHHKIINELNQGMLIKKAITEHKLPTQLHLAYFSDNKSAILVECIKFLNDNFRELKFTG